VNGENLGLQKNEAKEGRKDGSHKANIVSPFLEPSTFASIVSQKKTKNSAARESLGMNFRVLPMLAALVYLSGCHESAPAPGDKTPVNSESVPTPEPSAVPDASNAPNATAASPTP
jgi:hypothetical protein